MKKSRKWQRDITALGSKKAKYFKWKRDLLDIFEDFTLSEKEKKRIVLSTTVDTTHELCEELYFEEKSMTAEEFINKIEEIIETDKISTFSSEKLEHTKIGKKNVRIFNLHFNDLLNEIKDKDKPSEFRLIVLYIKGLKEKRSLYSVMIAKKFDSLKQAMEFALRIDSRIQVYEDEGEYSNQNSNSNSKYLKKNNFNKQYYNKKNRSKSPTKNLDNRHINTSESSDQKYNSDLDKLTKKFANMSLHVCHHCSKKGHEAHICTNKLSEHNKNLLDKFTHIQNNLN